jgi:hypothetical protein
VDTHWKVKTWTPIDLDLTVVRASPDSPLDVEKEGIMERFKHEISALSAELSHYWAKFPAQLFRKKFNISFTVIYCKRG